MKKSVFEKRWQLASTNYMHFILTDLSPIMRIQKSLSEKIVSNSVMKGSSPLNNSVRNDVRMISWTRFGRI
ncbi:hypothetical protein CUS89_12595 [Enterococcus mundtii]|uniref:Uncharacterized protein n=1 Tax=Enterococcus mundtii TaxID=53346 RepID=A0A2S7RQM0_ENTMU|nr:hypothetical protein CUS89_12595 [Enterococcus mundtii]